VRVINPKISAEDNTCARVSEIPQQGARVVEVLRPTGLRYVRRWWSDRVILDQEEIELAQDTYLYYSDLTIVILPR
jgi:hypothetical protein